ncbi:transcription factor HES-2-like [Anoplophora glabripennis]|uniref:transcription factor HES-2-like n=1 Tax=Anoplophora glabripennis TaxID=217634 RepID=UPI0008736ED5|nr:transcription factor HES-2-like [Anoplophora glabripennis]
MASHSENRQLSESRKIRKPIMEKKRRARINESLETLKKILLECNPHRTDQKNVKLEKADILEMTVRYLQHLKKSTGMKKLNQCGEKVTEICPADSSTNDLKSNIALKPALSANDTRHGNVTKNFRTGVGFGGLYSCAFPFAAYNCMGVVNMALSVTYGSNQRFYEKIQRQPDLHPTENVWRPW